MAERKKAEKKFILPVLPLRGLVVFPFTIIPFDVGRPRSVKALEEAMLGNQVIYLAAQRDENNQNPGFDDLHVIGTIARVKQLIRLPGDTIRVLVEGICRGAIREELQEEPFMQAEIMEFREDRPEAAEEEEKGKGRGSGSGREENPVAVLRAEAMRRTLRDAFEKYTQLSGKIAPEALQSVLHIKENGRLADLIASNMGISFEARQQVLDTLDPFKRMEILLEMILKETDIQEIENDINQKVRHQMEKLQREYYLREQVKIIQGELGEKSGATDEITEYREKLESSDWPEEVSKRVSKELERLAKMPQGSPEVAVIRTYLDLIFELPWTTRTEAGIDLKQAEKILEQDHYGLEKVKERIVEYLAVNLQKQNMKGPILCLVGPPGVGKTSIAKSIARAVNRNYVRMSLGGVRDEAEIRGHRRTYVGALPGRIITALRQAGSNNPLMLLDEIDKMSADFRGDPSSAMLEVLDGEQNFAFRDHYLEIPFDLSQVMFITTANHTDPIPRPLLDRMEVIRIPGYTSEEKLEIALRYLVPKQLDAHGLKKRQIRFTPEAVRHLIDYYTREAGVRNLEREIATICRKATRQFVEGKRMSWTITPAVAEKLLGAKKFRFDKMRQQDQVGLATGLAWTPVGGDTLTIEVNLVAGNGKLELTGQLGDVMKESARAAISFIRANAAKYGIQADFTDKNDIHIHVPEGATPKDGPSAGITLATALISAVTGIPVRHNVAMTGEITLRGRVLPIGGLKEKVLAARRSGIDTIILPEDNIRDLDEIPDPVRQEIRFHPVKSMEEVLSVALTSSPAASEVSAALSAHVVPAP